MNLKHKSEWYSKTFNKDYYDDNPFPYVYKETFRLKKNLLSYLYVVVFVNTINRFWFFLYLAICILLRTVWLRIKFLVQWIWNLIFCPSGQWLVLELLILPNDRFLFANILIHPLNNTPIFRGLWCHILISCLFLFLFFFFTVIYH